MSTATNTPTASKPAGPTPVKPVNKAKLEATKAAPKPVARGAKPAKTATDAADKRAAAEKRTAEEKAASAAAAEKAKADKRAEAEKAKAKKIAEFHKIVDPLAKEINVRMEKADKLESDADDHRVAAALQLAKAKETCRETGQSFEKWCAEVIPQRSFETLRKLAYAGAKEDVKLAIADMRAKNNATNQKHNKKKSLLAAEGKKALGKKMTTQAPAPELVARDVLAELPDAKRTEIVQEAAKKLGLAVVTTEEAKTAADKAPPKITASLEGMKTLFQGLDTKARIDFVVWAGKLIGATVTVPDFLKEAKADDAGDVPDFLRVPPKAK